MKQLFKSEEQAIAWVASNIALAIQPKDKRKTMYLFPYISHHAHKIVVEGLGKELFKHQQTINENNQ